MGTPSELRLIWAKVEALLDAPTPFTTIAQAEAQQVMFWFFVILTLVGKHQDVLFETMIASPRSHMSVRSRQSDLFWNISKTIDGMKEKIWEVGMGLDMCKYDYPPTYDPIPIPKILQSIFHDLDVLLTGLMQLESDLFRLMTKVEHLQARLFLVKRKAQCERFWRCLMATCWNSGHIREIVYYMNPGGWLNCLAVRLDIYTGFERGPQLLIPGESIEGDCFICMQGLNEWVDYEAKHVPDLLQQRPFPEGQIYLTTAPPSTIMKTRCCTQVLHKSCMIRAVAGTDRCPHCRAMLTVEEAICLWTDMSREMLMGTMAITKHLANPRRPVQRWTYRDL